MLKTIVLTLLVSSAAFPAPFYKDCVKVPRAKALRLFGVTSPVLKCTLASYNQVLPLGVTRGPRSVAASGGEK